MLMLLLQRGANVNAPLKVSFVFLKKRNEKELICLNIRTQQHHCL